MGFTEILLDRAGRLEVLGGDDVLHGESMVAESFRNDREDGFWSLLRLGVSCLRIRVSRPVAKTYILCVC